MKRALILIVVLCALVLALVLLFAPSRATQELAPDAHNRASDSSSPSVALEADTTANAQARDLAPLSDKTPNATNHSGSASSPPDPADTEASVEGKVVRPDGKPAPLARVQYLQLPDGRPLDQAIEDSTVTDDSGHFHLAPVPTGKIRLIASHDEFAASSALFIDIAEHEHRADLTLLLRGFGRVEGFVRDAHNLAQPQRTVTCGDQFSGKALFADSDNSGHFAFEKVTPGAYLVSVKLPDTELAQMKAEAPFLPLITMGADHQHWIEVKEGETVQLVLGGVPAGGVHVTGRIGTGPLSAGDRPLVHAWLSAVTLDGDEFLPLPHARTDERGEYELWLRTPGRFDFQLAAGGGATDLNRRVVVPARAEFRLDFELSSASLAGRVVDRAGKPVANQVVGLSYNGPLPGSAAGAIESLSPDVVTGEDGRFSFQHLQAGRYSCSVRGKQEPNSDEALAYGCVHTEEFTIESGVTLEGVEIVLTPGCVLRGVVHGAPEGKSANARVVVWDEKGQMILSGRCDPDGSFVVRGLPEGDLCAGASLGMQASPVSAPVRLSASKEGFVELTLGGGAMMNVFVRAEQGTLPASYQVLIKDAQGRAVYDSYCTSDDPSQPVWVQVLPVGPYTVDVYGADGSQGTANAGIEAGKVERVDVLLKRAK